MSFENHLGVCGHAAPPLFPTDGVRGCEIAMKSAAVYLPILLTHLSKNFLLLPAAVATSLVKSHHLASHSASPLTTALPIPSGCGPKAKAKQNDRGAYFPSKVSLPKAFTFLVAATEARSSWLCSAPFQRWHWNSSIENSRASRCRDQFSRIRLPTGPCP